MDLVVVAVVGDADEEVHTRESTQQPPPHVTRNMGYGWVDWS